MSTLTTISMLAYAAMSLAALGWSAWIVRYGVPVGQRCQSRSTNARAWRGRLPLTIANMVLVAAAFGAGMEALSTTVVAQQPGWAAGAAQLLFLVVVDDAWFYVFHRWAHESRWAYNTIHRIHHRAYAPLPSDFLYVHPAEWMLGAVGVPLGAVLLSVVTGGVSLPVVLAFGVFRTWKEVCAHAGYRFHALSRIPLVASPEHHDRHHARPHDGNYASSLVLWDRLMGTMAREGQSGGATDLAAAASPGPLPAA